MSPEGLGETLLQLLGHALDVGHPRDLAEALGARAGTEATSLQVRAGVGRATEVARTREFVRGALGLLHRGRVLLNGLNGQIERGVDVRDRGLELGL